MKKIDHIGQRVSNNLHTILVIHQDATEAIPAATINLTTALCVFKDKRYMKSKVVVSEIKDIIKRLNNTLNKRDKHYTLTFDSSIVGAEKKAEKLNDTTLLHSSHKSESVKIRICEKLRIPKANLNLVRIYEQSDFLDLLFFRKMIIKDKYFSALTIHLTNV